MAWRNLYSVITKNPKKQSDKETTNWREKKICAKYINQGYIQYTHSDGGLLTALLSLN